MSLVDKINTRRLESLAMARAAPYLPRLMLPQSNWSPAVLLDQQTKKHPNSPTIKYLDQQISWAELADRVDRTAAALCELGIQKSDKVIVLLDNRPEFIVYLLALSRLQAVSALINTSLVGKSLAHCINIAKARCCLVGSEHAEKIDTILPQLDSVSADAVWLIEDIEADTGQHAQLLSDTGFGALNALIGKPGSPVDRSGFPAGRASVMDVCCYIYTSGTTGLPKPAIVRNQRLLAGGVLFGKAMLNVKQRESLYVTSPLFHTAGISLGFGSTLITGACLVLRRQFSVSEFWHDVRNYHVDAFIYIGELCRYLVNQPTSKNDRQHGLRAMAGVGLRPDVWREFIERFGVSEIYEAYGATEGSSPLYNFTGKIGMIGRRGKTHGILRCDLASGELARNADWRYEEIDEGETGLLINRITPASPYDGYVDAGASEKKRLRNVFKEGDCYFDTGDLVTLHKDGWLSFADRVGDTFRWKGENVSTNEVAEILNACTGVLESNVYGVHVPGNDGRAGMASINISSEFDLSDLAKIVASDLASYQRPYFLRLQKDMRITQTFKHQKVAYQKEGFDPDSIADELYFLREGQFEPLDKALFEQINSGAVELR